MQSLKNIIIKTNLNARGTSCLLAAITIGIDDDRGNLVDRFNNSFRASCIRCRSLQSITKTIPKSN